LRRAGYERWLRNLAVGLGNAPSTIPVLEALKARRDYPSELVKEHVEWALSQHSALIHTQATTLPTDGTGDP
jgi:epoxyqueuosine reductase